MYNTYLLPVYDVEAGVCYIECISAYDLLDAKDKFIKFFCDNFNIDIQEWDELEVYLCEKCNIIIGDVYDKEEF